MVSDVHLERFFINSDFNVYNYCTPRVYLLIEDKSGTTKLYASATTRLPSAHFGETKLICQLVAVLLFGVKIKGYV